MKSYLQRNYPKIIFAIIILAILASYLHHYLSFRKFLNTPVIPLPHKSVVYIFPHGSSINALAHDLHTQGLLEDPKMLIRLADRRHLIKKLQAGEYEFPPGMLPMELLDKIANGKVLIHTFTIIEGWNFKMMIEALNKNEAFSHTVEGLTPDAIMMKLGHPTLAPEGHFFPDTYSFVRGTSDTVILLKAIEKMDKTLKEEWSQREQGLLYLAPEEALIVASLIEKETADAQEKPMVATVILNRLKLNMPLQIDAAVIYGLGDSFDHKVGLKHSDLATVSPYNTYVHKGLPPTAIAMPSLSSLHAALHPTPGDWLYYVANGSGQGTHHFSVTSQEHIQAVKAYKQSRNIQGKK